MAVKQYSRQLTMQLTIVLFLGWLAIIIWALSQWMLHGYSLAFEKVNTLVNTQREAITPVYQGSLLAVLPFNAKPDWAFAIPYLNKLAINDLAKDLIEKSQQFLQIILLSSQCLLIKLIILFAALPLFALTMIAGLVDGLNQRAIRTACLGRESSYVFHRLNHYLKKGLVILLMLWLALPVSITPAYVFVPVSLLMGLMVAMTASRFKKYL
ncbi:TPA: TIGR03747 family integrating conjugative element membrane protein [Legionella pneumophila subsp. pneumophila]|uniref:TIGR03747 family integrating conjugative element membrane protein n=1 Tax=Legionella sp. PATHC039 TaxID=2992042 RepID=UPI001A2F4B65|nr:TIGR03747 family integrating conjugative element membrane protein [Legionella sp. PATHC039]MCW8394144.1 TIGR03747 family integrating conjugative element membrane protein [Legionella sp. PATHC039]HAT8857642.1 TIGR03747 family integrating conjugative element membrane protein [Legionella pneumophila subsp. pneumophila]HAT9651962.1 TIGR03747 family integrating conjugative element membrane protein [Legionella pneumophila subsp. pneumophila]HAT9919205.1 TIGR03747 family integrating conjugative ele